MPISIYYAVIRIALLQGTCLLLCGNCCRLRGTGVLRSISYYNHVFVSIGKASKLNEGPQRTRRPLSTGISTGTSGGTLLSWTAAVGSWRYRVATAAVLLVLFRRLDAGVPCQQQESKPTSFNNGKCV